MSQVKAAKDELSQAITIYKFAKNGVSTALNQNSERALSVKLTKFEDALSQLNAAHTTWVTKAEFTDELLAAETYNTAWLEKIWEEYGALYDKADEQIQKNKTCGNFELSLR